MVAAAAASVLRPVSLEAPLRGAWGLVATTPEGPWWRTGRALGLIAASTALQRQGRDAEAQAFAERAVREEPENAAAYVVLARAAQTRAPVTAQLASGRALALSPLDPPPVSPRPPDPPAGPAGSAAAAAGP